MVKLRQFQIALHEFSDIGNFEDTKYRYESYPDLYPNRRGSFVPFSLRLIHAEIVSLTNKERSLDPLYNLLALCQQRMRELQNKFDSTTQHTTASASATQNRINNNNKSNNGFVLSVGQPYQSFTTPSFLSSTLNDEYEDENWNVWSQRENRVIFAIVNRLLREREYTTAIQIYGRTLQKDPNDPFLLSALGRIFFLIGNIKATEAIFNQVEQLIADTDSSSLIQMNRWI
jgi:tetratricopeptide (TPR) repeat protein